MEEEKNLIVRDYVKVYVYIPKWIRNPNLTLEQELEYDLGITKLLNTIKMMFSTVEQFNAKDYEGVFDDIPTRARIKVCTFENSWDDKIGLAEDADYIIIPEIMDTRDVDYNVDDSDPTPEMIYDICRRGRGAAYYSRIPMAAEIFFPKIINQNCRRLHPDREDPHLCCDYKSRN